jgi:hypothetical protein
MDNGPATSRQRTATPPQKFAELTEKYQAVMRELEQLRARPSTFPCDRLISELTHRAARLRTQLQKLGGPERLGL